MILDVVILMLTQGIFFSFGWLFFEVKLFRDYEVQGRVPSFLFSLTFSLSLGMFLLILFEILDILETEFDFCFFFSWI